MRISDILKSARDPLIAWSSGHQGTAEISHSIIHLFGVLSLKPGGFRVCVHWNSQNKRGLFEEASMVDEEFWVALSFGKSLSIDKASSWTDGDGNGEPWFDLVEQAREVIRAITFDPTTTESVVDYLGAYPLTQIAEGFLVDGMYLKFTLGNLMTPPAP